MSNRSFIKKMKLRGSKKEPIILSPRLRVKRLIKEESKIDEPFKNKNIIGKIVYILIQAPLDFVRKITIPPSDEVAWDRRYASAVPIFSVFFIFVVTGLIDFKSVPHISYWILQGIGFAVALLIWFTTPLREEPKRSMIIFSIIAFALSILWMWSAVNILVDLLGVLGMILGFNPAFLGMTLLAWGNSFGEVMANSTFARRGLGRMAFTA